MEYNSKQLSAKQGYSHNGKLTDQENNKKESALNSTQQNKIAFIQEFFKDFDNKVEDLMRVILKVQKDISKLLEISLKEEILYSKSYSFQDKLDLVCIDLKFITLQAKIFENQMNEYKTRLNDCMQNNFATGQLKVELNRINYLNDIQKAIFDNYFDPVTKNFELEGSNLVSEKNQPNSRENSTNLVNREFKQQNQINSDQIFSETSTSYSSDIIIQQSRFEGTSKAKNIENDDENSVETPTDQGDIQDVGQINNEESGKNGLQKNINSLEQDQIKKQQKRRYPVEQKVEIVKEIISKTFYKEKKIIPKQFLDKYQICYQTLQNWIKKYHQISHE